MLDEALVSPFSSGGYANDWEWIGDIDCDQHEQGDCAQGGDEGEWDGWEQPSSNASSSSSLPSCFKFSISSIASDTSLDLFVARATIRVYPDPFLDPAIDPDCATISIIRRRSLHPVACLDPDLLMACIMEDDCDVRDSTPPDAPVHPRAKLLSPVTSNCKPLPIPTPSQPLPPVMPIKSPPLPLSNNGRPPLCPFSAAVVRTYYEDSLRLAYKEYRHYTSGEGSVFRRVMARQPTPTNPDTTFTLMTALPLTLCTNNRIYTDDSQRYNVARRRHAAQMKLATTAQDQFAALRTYWRQIGTLHLYKPPPPRPSPLRFTLPVEDTDSDTDSYESSSVEEQGATSAEDEPTSSASNSIQGVTKAALDTNLNLLLRG